MRRPLALCLLLVLLAGCGTQPASQETPEPKETPPVTDVPAVTDQPTVTNEPAVTDTPAPASPVYTDWSKLSPYEPQQPVYTYHAGYCGMGALAARDDYGVLLPYIGRYATMEMYVTDILPLYGLVTDGGKLVSAPVYTNISVYENFLVLYRADSDGTHDSCTLTAPDGSWVRELDSGSFLAGGEGEGLLMTAGADGSLDLWNRAGETVMHFDKSLFTPWLGEALRWGEEDGPWVDWIDDKVGYAVDFIYVEDQPQTVRLYLDFESGAVTDTPPEGYPAEIDYASIPDTEPEAPVIEGCNYLDRITDAITGETYFSGYYRSGEEDTGFYALFDSEGRLLVKNADLWRYGAAFTVHAGLYPAVEDGYFCYRALADQSLVFRYPMWTNTD